MTTATASHPLRVSTSVLVTIGAVIGVGVGLLVGFGVASRGSATATPASQTVVADNATVDTLLTTLATGSADEIKPMLVRTFRFTSTNAEPVRNVTTMNLMAGEWQAAGLTLVRTSDVARVDDVLFVGGEYRYADASKEAVPFTWTIRLATDGTRIASIHETFH